MLKAHPDSGALFSSSSFSSTVPSLTNSYNSSPSSVARPTTPSTDMATASTSRLRNQYQHQQNTTASNAQNTKEAPKPVYSFQRPFINGPPTVHSFVSPPSLSRNPHSTVPHTQQQQQQHHQKLFTTATSKSCFSSPPCSGRVGVGLQAGADSNLPHPTTRSQLSPQPYLRDRHLQNQQQQQQQQGRGGVRRFSGSNSVFMPILNMLAASASSVASQQQQHQRDILNKEDRSTSGDGGADGNGIQCDDLPPPDYLILSSSHTNSHSTVSINKTDRTSPRAPHSILLSSSLTLHGPPASPSDTSIPSIAIMPTADILQQHHYLTPELVAMENGVDPTRLSLLTTSAKSHDGIDRSRRLDTPLLDLQEQGYAAEEAIAGSSSPSPSEELESRRAGISIVTNGLGSVKEGKGRVAVKGGGPVLMMSGSGPMSAGDGDGLDRRYWHPAESVEDFTSYVTDREEIQEVDQPDMETVNSVTSTTDSPRRRVRFMEEIQVIPSSRTGSDDDDDLTLIEDSEDDSFDDDDNNNNNSVKKSLDVLPTTNPTAKSNLSEWKAVQVVESFLALEGVPVGTEKEHSDGGDASAPVTVIAHALTPDPWTVALPPSPNPSVGTVEDDEGGCGYDHAVVPCPPTVLLQLALVTTSPTTTTTTTASSIESPPPAAATLKSVPPSITTTTTTAHIKTSDENSNTCISPRTLELISVRSQLLFWTETASVLQDQEQSLTLHIDQLVQVMADVIEKCQETENELLDHKRVVFELRLELDKEREIGFASIQEAALSNREKQLLELALGKSRKEVENLRRICAQQRCVFEEERRALTSQLAKAEAQIRVQATTQEQEQSQLGQRGFAGVQDVDCQEDQDQDQHKIEQPLLPIDNNDSCKNVTPTQKPIIPLSISQAKVQQEDLYLFQFLFKSPFLFFAATFVLLSITIVISGHQQYLLHSFNHFLNTLTSFSTVNTTIHGGYLHHNSPITTGFLKDMIEWMGGARVLFEDLSFLVRGVGRSLVWGDQQGLRLVRTWS